VTSPPSISASLESPASLPSACGGEALASGGQGQGRPRPTQCLSWWGCVVGDLVRNVHGPQAFIVHQNGRLPGIHRSRRPQAGQAGTPGPFLASLGHHKHQAHYTGGIIAMMVAVGTGKTLPLTLCVSWLCIIIEARKQGNTLTHTPHNAHFPPHIHTTHTTHARVYTFPCYYLPS